MNSKYIVAIISDVFWAGNKSEYGRILNVNFSKQYIIELISKEDNLDYGDEISQKWSYLIFQIIYRIIYIGKNVKQ